MLLDIIKIKTTKTLKLLIHIISCFDTNRKTNIYHKAKQKYSYILKGVAPLLILCSL